MPELLAYILFCILASFIVAINFTNIFITYMVIIIGIALVLILLSNITRKIYLNKNKNMSAEEVGKKIASLITSSDFSEKEHYLDSESFIESMGMCFMITLIPIFQIMNIFFIINSLRLIFRRDKDLAKIKFRDNKNDETLTDNLPNEISIIKKYDSKNSKFIEKTIKDKSNPYTQLINDNYRNLINILTEKEKELDSTFNTNKKSIIKKDIKSLISKYSVFLKSIETNLVENELKTLNNFNDMLLNIKEELNNNSKPINELINGYTFENSTCHSNKDIISKICYYDLPNMEHILDEKEVIVFDNLLQNKNFPCNEFINNLGILMVHNVCNLENKKKFLFDTNALDDEIALTINNYVCLVKILDKKFDTNSNKLSEEYSELLDSVIEDIKNKKVIFK